MAAQPEREVSRTRGERRESKRRKRSEMRKSGRSVQLLQRLAEKGA